MINQRRYDIDWLRIILFGLLIPFHVAIGVYWSTYGGEINPNLGEITETDRLEIAEEGNDYTAESVSPISMFLHWMHQWRLAALFMISGMGTAFAYRKRIWKDFLKERTKRLIVPMFFGAWTMGFASQVITGEISLDAESLISSFLLGILWRSLIFWIPIFGKLLALGHLWFLWNLFFYSVLMIPIFNAVRNNPEGFWSRSIKRVFSMRWNIGPLFLMPFMLSLTEILFKPWFPGFIGVAYEWFWFLIFFAIGFSCIVAKSQWYSFLNESRAIITIFALLSTIAFIWIRLEQHSSGIPYVEGGWILGEPFVFHNGMTLIACLIHSFHAMYWCLVVFAWGAHLLNHPSNGLAYLNQGVYPFYIAHMPLVFLGLRLSGELGLRDLSAVLFASVVTTASCWAFFEIVRRMKRTRFLFGIKNKTPQSKPANNN